MSMIGRDDTICRSVDDPWVAMIRNCSMSSSLLSATTPHSTIDPSDSRT